MTTHLNRYKCDLKEGFVLEYADRKTIEYPRQGGPSRFEDIQVEKWVNEKLGLSKHIRITKYSARNTTTTITYRNAADQVHRDDDGPAYVSFKNKLIQEMEWYWAGTQHRASGGPQRIKNTESSVEFLFRQNGLITRDEDKPAIVRFHSWSGGWFCATKSWYHLGKIHRSGKPAIIDYNSAGKVTQECWYQNGVFSRIDGPSKIMYSFPDSRYGSYIKIYQAWYKNGKQHRLDGPAVIAQNGRDLSWFINDSELDPKKFVAINEDGSTSIQLTRQNALDAALNFDREYGSFLLDRLKEMEHHNG